MFQELSVLSLIFSECGNCKHPYFIGEVSAYYSETTRVLYFFSLLVFFLYDHLLIQLSHFNILVSTADAERYVSRLRKGNGR